MDEMKNIDGILTNTQAPIQPISNPQPDPEPPTPAQQNEPEEYQEAAISEPVKQEKNDNQIDEYGNPVEKPKVYTEEEVQRMIRDRLSRGRHAENNIQQHQRNDSEGFKADQDSEESWEVQLEQFIEKTIEKRQTKLSQQQWREQETAKQAEFESKFSSGMNKYADFNEVVMGKPITDSMMLATRHLDNPAAFIYGAAKLHAQDLERISKIQDQFIQAAEIGRLHEKMVKVRLNSSSAPKPLDMPKSDIPGRANHSPSIDQRIAEHAKQKFSRG